MPDIVKKYLDNRKLMIESLKKVDSKQEFEVCYKEITNRNAEYKNLCEKLISNMKTERKKNVLKSLINVYNEHMIMMYKANEMVREDKLSDAKEFLSKEEMRIGKYFGRELLVITKDMNETSFGK